jgi:hypothetical protein
MVGKVEATVDPDAVLPDLLVFLRVNRPVPCLGHWDVHVSVPAIAPSLVKKIPRLCSD